MKISPNRLLVRRRLSTRDFGWQAAVLLLGVVSQVPRAEAGWKMLPGVGLGQIHDVCFVDQRRAWMTVGDGMVRTKDMGRTWRSVALPEADFNERLIAVRVLPRADGTVFGWALSSSGRIYHTADGVGWKRQHVLPEAIKNQLGCLEVLDEKHAWVSGFGFTGRTTDGGVTWKLVHPADGGLLGANFKDEAAHQVIHFRDEKNGTAVVSGGYLGAITRSTADGGATWKRDEVPKGRKATSSYRVFRSGRSIRVYTREGELLYSHGAMPLKDEEVAALLARSAQAEGSEIVSTFKHQYHVLAERVVAAFEQLRTYTNALQVTTDGGVNWSRRYSGTGCGSIHFVDKERGWAAGGGGLVSRTSDGGVSWELRFLPTEANFQHVFFLNDKAGWLGGGTADHGRRGEEKKNGGCVWRTTDGGETWEEVAVLENGRPGRHQINGEVRGLWFDDIDTGWALTHGTSEAAVNGYTSYARILRTADGGRTWREVYLSDGTALQDINRRGEVWSAAGSGVFLSRDGENWERTAARGTLFAIAQPNAEWLFAVGESGMLVFSKDGGKKWRNSEFGALERTHLDSIEFGTEKVGWIAGSSSTEGIHNGLFMTNDGGRTWGVAEIDWPASAPPASMLRTHSKWVDLSAVDGKHAWAVGGAYGRQVVLRFEAEAE